jgi:hypothetical protein
MFKNNTFIILLFWHLIWWIQENNSLSSFIISTVYSMRRFALASLCAEWSFQTVVYRLGRCSTQDTSITDLKYKMHDIPSLLAVTSFPIRIIKLSLV